MSKFGDVIQKRRRKMGLTQEALTAELSICKSYLSKIERGHTGTPPGPALIAAIAEKLDLNPEELFYLSGRISDEDEIVLREIVRSNYQEMPRFFKTLKTNPERVRRALNKLLAEEGYD